MFPLWEVAIAPVLDAARAKRVVEIGALRGETTVLMLDRLGSDAELHVIDPVPEFDPAEHEERFPGRYIFHRDTSHNVLPELGPMDAALIDGDHNWYTVHHELRLLDEAARRAGAPLPVLILHDVGWPYGRRDLYYEPDRIPAEYRQPYRQAGMRPDRRQLLPKGGLNPTMFNAEVEGGERNGVMTAVDDFIAEYGKPLRLLFLPVYFGLAIVVEQERLDANPALVAALDRLESSEGRHELLKVSEDVRLQAMIFQHNVYYPAQDKLARATQRYLDVLKAALLDEHYLENEARFSHLTQRMAAGRAVDADALRDPARHDKEGLARIQRQRLGPSGPNIGSATSFLPYTAMGRTRLDHLERSLDIVRVEGVRGDLAECGTGRGGGAVFMRAYLDAHEVPGRRVWVADRFRASPEPDREPALPATGIAGFQADLNLVRDAFDRFGVLDDRVRFLQGPYDATLPDAPIEDLALLRIGYLGASETRSALDFLYDKLAPGGFVTVDNHQNAACAKEVAAFRAERGVIEPLQRVDASAVAWRKSAADARGSAANVSAAPGARAPLTPAAPQGALDLTVVVVMYNMKREAARTLHALSRAFQEGIDDATYEVIVVENGSDESEKLTADYVEGFGSEFRYVDLAGEAKPSPVFALNRGIALGRGRAFALMIDGAHVVTPGVLRFGLAGLKTYEPAIVVTQQWYVGPGQQGDAMDDGYDVEYEDRLFKAINWPHAGYRLFEIGHFIGDRDWLDGVWESNCIFVPRKLLQQVGAFDEGFTVAGGGYANLEIYERLGSAADVTVATIVGEGSFHQTHGGTTTNQPDAGERRSRIFGYGETYADMRGRPFKGPGKPLHFVGRIATGAARRTKPRRMSGAMFANAAGMLESDARPDTPTPIPDELKWSFVEAAWRSLPWRRTTWLGRQIATAPSDLLAYHEIIDQVHPDWIVEIGSGDAGRSLFLASMCELVGHGDVVTVDEALADDRPSHARLHYIAGTATAETTVRQVQDLVAAGRGMVILGSCVSRAETTAQFAAYSGLVAVGSYAVIADTIVNGHPVWTAFGPGPAESVKEILNRHGDFMQDPTMEKYALSFNPGGFLKRVR